MKLSIITLFLIIIVGFNDCTKSDNSEFTDSPIIESYLKPGFHPLVKISRQTPFDSTVNYSSDDINALSITIKNNDAFHTLTPLGEGQYIDSTLNVAEGERYDISFAYNSKTVTAYTKVPSRPSNFKQSATTMTIAQMSSSSGIPTSMPTMPDPLSLTWSNDDGSYYIVVIENMEETLTPIRDFGDRTPPGNMFRKSPTTSSGIEIQSMEFQYYGKHRLILYHVLPDYASLYSDTQSSSQNLTNPSTSIMNGYGIFTGLNSDTLFINIKK
jgi:Domain of unknown function (DUF4249)